MKTFGRGLWLAVALMFLAVPVVSARSTSPKAESKQEKEGILVGRVSHVEGQMLRYVPEDKDWVAIVKDSPFGFEDALYAGTDGKAEIILPNNTWERMGGDTQLQLIALKPDVSELDVASGIARFFNKSNKTVIKATTPYGYVMAQPGTSFDLYVGDKSVEVIALKGTVDFVHVAGNSKFEVVAGSGSIVADSERTAPGEGNVDADWDDWNVERDKVWTERLAVKGDSTEYLPQQLHDEAYSLEENGRWERVYYEGSYRNYWRPSSVEPGWSPYTYGRWSDWYGDQCWIPYEPFGYVTHHYGSWAYINNYWYWAPPVVSVSIGPSYGWGWGFGWYPGRVSWIYSTGYVGWVPLAPFEPYYCNRYWGPGVVVGVGVGFAGVSINIGGLAYLGHAVVVPGGYFYGGWGHGGHGGGGYGGGGHHGGYHSVRVTNINRTTIINNYRASPVVNNTVLSNYKTMGGRHAFSDTPVTSKPMPTVVNRIQKNQDIARRTGSGLTAQSVTRSVTSARPGTLQRTAAVESPKVTSRLTPSGAIGTAGAGAGAGTAGAVQQRDLKARSAAPKQSEGFMQGGTTSKGTSTLGKGGATGSSGQAVGSTGGIQAPRADRKVRSTTTTKQGQSVGSTGGTSTSRSRETLGTTTRSGQSVGSTGGTSTSRSRDTLGTTTRSGQSVGRTGGTSTSRSRESLGTGTQSGQSLGGSRGTATTGTGRDRSLQSTGRSTTQSRDLQRSRSTASDRRLQGGGSSSTSGQYRRSGSSSVDRQFRGGSAGSAGQGISRSQAGAARGGQSAVRQSAPGGHQGSFGGAPKGGGGGGGGGGKPKTEFGK